MQQARWRGHGAGRVLDLQAQRVVGGRRQRRRVQAAVQPQAQHMFLAAQVLAAAQPVGARVDEAAQTAADFAGGVGLFLDQQVRLEHLLRHRHEHAQPVAHRQVDRAQAGAFFEQQVQLLQRHRRGKDVQRGREETVDLGAHVDGAQRQQPGRRQQAQLRAECIDRCTGQLRFGQVLRQLFDTRLPQEAVTARGDAPLHRVGRVGGPPLQGLAAWPPARAHDRRAVGKQWLPRGVEGHQRQRHADAVPRHGLGRSELGLAAEQLVGQPVAPGRVGRAQRQPFFRPGEVQQPAGIAALLVFEGFGLQVAFALVEGVGAVHLPVLDRLEHDDAHARHGAAGKQLRAQASADAARIQHRAVDRAAARGRCVAAQQPVRRPQRQVERVEIQRLRHHHLLAHRRQGQTAVQRQAPRRGQVQLRRGRGDGGVDGGDVGLEEGQAQALDHAGTERAVEQCDAPAAVVLLGMQQRRGQRAAGKGIHAPLFTGIDAARQPRLHGKRHLAHRRAARRPRGGADLHRLLRLSPARGRAGSHHARTA